MILYGIQGEMGRMFFL